MKLHFSDDLTSTVEQSYRDSMAAYPAKKREVDVYLAGCTPEHATCLRFLYSCMHVNDVVSFSVGQIDAYVQSTLAAYETFPTLQAVPEKIFLSYVLPYRVNDEHPDESRDLFYRALKPRVAGKGAYDAALEVNLWCCEHASYMPSDTRTLGPLTLMKTSLGRCGEESVFVVSALRSVGIPARQCYVGRWSHCDDTHAWVEVWIDGVWHYLGGCEPEPALDRGWFTAAASRSMLTYSRLWSGLVEDKNVAYRTPLYTLVNSTDSYADTAILTVRVLSGGEPASDVQVDFQLVNYSEFYTIYSGRTNSRGEVAFQTGLGDLYVHVFAENRLLTERVDVRKTRRITLELEKGHTLDELDGTLERFDLVPPAERVSSGGAAEPPAEHIERLAACDKTREDYKADFLRGENSGAFRDYRVQARGNLPQLDAFLADSRFTNEEKAELLATLRPKDFLDCTKEMLADALLAARPYRGTVPLDIYRPFILSPRIYDEMLLPVRAYIREKFPDGFASGAQVLDWLIDHVRIMPHYDAKTICGDVRGVLIYGYASAESFGTAFVAVCRTFGIPARRNSVTLEFEWADPVDGTYVFRRAANPPLSQIEPRASLRFVNETHSPLAYVERFTLGRFVDGRYQTMKFSGLLLDQESEVEVPFGHYVLVATTRQIDGTISVRAERFTVGQNRSIAVSTPEDATASRIRQVELLNSMPRGPVRDLLGTTGGGRILLFVDPGKEPTEHLLQELLSCREAYDESGCSVDILISAGEQRNNPTLKRVESSLAGVTVRVLDDAPAFLHLHRMMGIGDLRLPFALALDSRANGLFAFANYNINTAQTLLNILALSAKKEDSLQ